MNTRLLWLAVAVTLNLSLSATAQNHAACQLDEVVPATSANIEGNSGSTFPWNTTGAHRVMYAYGREAAGFDRPVRIRGVRYRADGAASSTAAVDYTFRLDVSTSRNPARALVPTFHDNHGADRVVVHNGTLVQGGSLVSPPGAHPFFLHVPFLRPFEWDPRSGPLLLDFRVTGASGVSGTTWDGVSGSGDIGRITDLSSANATVATYVGGNTQHFALVVDLCLEVDVVPEVYTTVEANGGSSMPLNWPNPARAMCAYAPAAFGFVGRHRISALSFRTNQGTTFGGASFDLRITMSTGANPASALNSAFQSNHGADAAVVFDGVHSAPPRASANAPGPFVVSIPLSQPFEYDPSRGPLIIDIAQRSLGGTAAELDAVSGSPHAYRVSNQSSATAASGLLDNSALVVGLNAEPVPTLPQAHEFTRGVTNSAYPFGISRQSRAMYQYGAGAIATNRRVYIQHLSWRPDSPGPFGPVTYTCTIDLSNSVVAAGSMSSVFDNNHGPNRQRVFSGTFSVPYIADSSDPTKFPISVKLDTPFYYNPAFGPLIVDLRMTDQIGEVVLADAGNGGELWRVVHGDNANAAVATIPSSGSENLALSLNLGGDGSNALSWQYGAGCAGTNGTPRCVNEGLPRLPNPDFRIRLLDGPQNSFAFLSLGLTTASNSLANFGAPGCTGLTGGELGALGVPTDSGGGAVVALPLPNSPTFSGFRFRTQWAALDAPANMLGVVFSDGQVHETRY